MRRHQHRDDPDAPLERTSHLEGDEILGIEDPPVAGGVGDGRPRLADDGEQHVGRGEPLAQDYGEPVARGNAFVSRKTFSVLNWRWSQSHRRPALALASSRR
jgi:hypothetical protein